eukprot:TRINITY_DN7927_c1_g1_i1.p1 TRINITY_DN7927_c1_g1~~TRINITY_DN7927_c1_g1_i1.p1  ORF type:complete len:169 (+),score=37.19 TRINITY_DN7927_c1_g1_i1:147-653(+)
MLSILYIDRNYSVTHTEISNNVGLPKIQTKSLINLLKRKDIVIVENDYIRINNRDQIWDQNLVPYKSPVLRIWSFSDEDTYINQIRTRILIFECIDNTWKVMEEILSIFISINGEIMLNDLQTQLDILECNGSIVSLYDEEDIYYKLSDTPDYYFDNIRKELDLFGKL